jgi:hypothetical protein
VSQIVAPLNELPNTLDADLDLSAPQSGASHRDLFEYTFDTDRLTDTFQDGTAARSVLFGSEHFGPIAAYR